MLNSLSRHSIVSGLPFLAWLILLAMTAWIYAPGVDGPSMLDDRASVLVLNELEESPQYAIDYVLGDNSGPLGRPVSMVSFVLEKLYLDDGISGGKKVNITLHLVNGCLVLWLLVLLLKYIHAPNYQWLAVLVSAAWMLSPIYVSTVLYVVQRMAMLAALFMLAATISYVYWRRALIQKRRGFISLALVFLFGILAVFSKETAIVILPVLLLLEALWFRFEGPAKRTLPWLSRFTLGLICFGAFALILFFTINSQWLVDSFQNRPFTVSERLITESKILWDYVFQIVAPDVARMGLYHDDEVVYKSLLANKSVFFSVLAWLAVFAFCGILVLFESGRLLAFAALFFIVGHSTESTIIPLELYYEHRNYFPGLGLFLLFAVLYAVIVKKWAQLGAPLLVYMAIYVVWLASQTGSQVQVWSNSSLLRLNDVTAHPDSFRANADMASEMARIGELEAALEYSAQAHRVNPGERQGDLDIRDLVLSCSANQSMPLSRIASIGTVDPERPLSSVATLNALMRLLQDNACPGFDRTVFANRMKAIFLSGESQNKAAANIYSRLAVLENTLERYDNASAYMDLFLLQSPHDTTGLLMKLHFSNALGAVDEVRDLKSKLQTMDEAGKLTLAQRNTLLLYLEN